MSFTQAQFEESMRLTLEPARMTGQLAFVEAPIVTALPSADTPVKIVGAEDLTITNRSEFTYDSGTRDFTFDRPGATDIWFQINVAVSFSQVAAASEVTMKLTKNGTAVDGIYLIHTIGTSGDVQIGYLKGRFQLDHGDYLNITVQGSKSGNFEGWSFSTDIKEEVQ